MALQVCGKTAIVTGAGSGINLAFAKLLLENNCNVLFADLTLRPESEAVIESHSGGKSPRAVFKKTDVTDWAQLEAMFHTAEQTFGGVDIVCPGAGVYEPTFSNFWVPPGDPRSVDKPHGSRYAAMDINLTHPIRCTQMAISHFVRTKRPGVVVHVSSVAAQGPLLSCPLYVAAKSALSNFVRSLAMLEEPQAASATSGTAVDGLPPIRVVAVAPGIIKTPLWTDNPDKLAWIDETQDDWITPEEVADVMLQLVQDPANVGGTVLEVSKGRVRSVQVRNDPGPSGPGSGASGAMQGVQEALHRLAQPGWGQP